MNHLQGKRILLTRTPAQNKITAPLLLKHGVTPILLPCLAIKNLNTNIQATLDKLTLADREGTDIIFSSSNGVSAFSANVSDLADTLKGFRIVAVGHKTALALTELGCEVHIIPNEASQQGLIESYKTSGLPRQAYFFRAEEGSDSLAAYFASQGVELQLVQSYRTSCHDADPSEIINQLQQQQIDAVLLGSAKTSAFFVQKINDLQLANSPVVAVMSPQVAQAADKLGLDVQVIAENPSFKAMLDGLNQYFAKN